MNQLIEVFKIFFYLGCIAFGGPAAHISLMREELVDKRKWLNQQQFLDMLGATNLIPGPNSTEMAMYCGWHRAGALGLCAAGIAFIIPAVMMTIILAWFYTEYGQLPEYAPVIAGIQSAVIVIIGKAIYKLAKKSMPNQELVLIGLIALILSITGIHPIIVILATGFIGILYFWLKNNYSAFSIIPIIYTPIVSETTYSLSSSSLLLIFLKVGALLYGSGYVLFAYLDAELVKTGWLSTQQLMDAIASGQLTPGPVLSTAAFIGYQLNGIGGALLATVGIFLPSFLLVFSLSALIKKIRQIKILTYFLDAVNVAAVAVMLTVLIHMIQTTLTRWENISVSLFSVIYILIAKEKAQMIWLILGSGLISYLLFLF